MKSIAIIHLSGQRYGGWSSFFAHLVYGMQEAAIPHRVYRVGNRTEEKSREYMPGIEYRNISLGKALKVARNRPTLLTAIETKGVLGERAYALVEAGAIPVIHDPNELRPEMRDLLGQAKTPVITVRSRNVENIEALGHEAICIPHPYKRAKPNKYVPPRKNHAVSISRIDFEKHIEIMAVANRMLPPDKQIGHFGFIFRPYAQHTLDKKFPDWRQNYVERWDCHDLYGGQRIAQTARYVVDMSWIKNDGGGTQYTHLEAWDAGARLILHENWMCYLDAGNEVQAAAAAIETPEQLAKLLNNDKEGKWPERQREAARILKAHDAAKIASRYESTMRKLYRKPAVSS